MFTLKLYKQSFCDKVKALWFKVFHKINNLFGLILKFHSNSWDPKEGILCDDSI